MKLYIFKTIRSIEFYFGRNVYLVQRTYLVDLRGNENFIDFLYSIVAILQLGTSSTIITDRIWMVAIFWKLNVKISYKHIFLTSAQQDEQFDTSYMSIGHCWKLTHLTFGWPFANISLTILKRHIKLYIFAIFKT